MTILNLTQSAVLAQTARCAAGFGSRLRGMIGRKFSRDFDGMVFTRCAAIHTLFMSCPVDVLFVSPRYRVLKTVENFPPWRPFLHCKNAFYVIELPIGTIAGSGTREHDLLDLTGVLSAEAGKRWREDGKMLRPSEGKAFSVQTG